MASSGDGEPVQYLYTPDLEDELYQQNLMLTHPTNILKLDDEGMANANPSTAAGGSRFGGELERDYTVQNSDDEDIEVGIVHGMDARRRNFFLMDDWMYVNYQHSYAQKS